MLSKADPGPAHRTLRRFEICWGLLLVNFDWITCIYFPWNYTMFTIFILLSIITTKTGYVWRGIKQSQDHKNSASCFPRFEISGSTSGHCLSLSMSHILYCPVTSPCQPILYCKINHLLRRKQIEKKILFQIMSICAKEKRLRHMSQDKTSECILYIELVIMIDVPPNIFFIFWLIDWLIDGCWCRIGNILAIYQQFISFWKHPQASVRSLVICSALKDYQRSVKVHGEIFLIGVTLGFER